MTDGSHATKSIEGHGLVPVELCVGSSWEQSSDLVHARFIVLPRVGDLVELPQRAPAFFRVVEVRHRSATPAGGQARIQLLARPSAQATHVRDTD